MSGRFFEAWRALAERFGPITVIPQKTRISFQVRVRFAGAAVRRDHVRCTFWLKRKVRHPMVDRTEQVTGRDFVYHFRLEDAAQLEDPWLRALVSEAYEVGCQRVRPRRRPPA